MHNDNTSPTTSYPRSALSSPTVPDITHAVGIDEAKAECDGGAVDTISTGADTSVIFCDNVVVAEAAVTATAAVAAVTVAVVSVGAVAAAAVAVAVIVAAGAVVVGTSVGGGDGPSGDVVIL